MDVFTIVVSSVAIISTVSGWVAVGVRGIKVRTELDVKTTARLERVEIDVATIKKVVTNGGLKDAVSQIQLNCGKEMARVATVLEQHVSLPGHTGVTEKLANLDARISNCEKELDK